MGTLHPWTLSKTVSLESKLAQTPQPLHPKAKEVKAFEGPETRGGHSFSWHLEYHTLIIFGGPDT